MIEANRRSHNFALFIRQLSSLRGAHQDEKPQVVSGTTLVPMGLGTCSSSWLVWTKQI